MPIIPTPITEAASCLVQGATKTAERLSTQVQSRVQQEVESITSGRVLGEIQEAAHQATGSLISQAKAALEISSGSASGVQSAGTGVTSGVVSGAVGGMDETYSSSDTAQWGHLSPYLIARIYPCNADGVEQFTEAGVSLGIKGPITEAAFDASLNWQSPFEQMGSESSVPTLAAVLQTGRVATVANALQSRIPDDYKGSALEEAIIGNAKAWSKDLEGLSGMTKLNSRQVFSGMPPIRVMFQFHLRAVSSAQAEVMQPFQRLLGWAFPQELAKDGVIEEIIRPNDKGFIRSMFPSRAPQMVGFIYGNNRYAPMVIEQIGHPLDGPMDKDGLPIYRAVQLTLATLTALDKNDVATIFRSS